MRKKFFNIYLLIFSFAILIVLSPKLQADNQYHRVWAIKDCKIVTMAGKNFQKGIVIIKDGLIEAVGENITIPEEAEIIDGKECSVYPGFIDALSQELMKFPTQKFDMTKIYSGNFNDEDRGYTPEVKAYDFIKLSKNVLKKYHDHGITAIHLLPQKGIFTGQSAVFSLSTIKKDKAVVLKDNTYGIAFSASSYGIYPSSLMGVIAFLRQIFSDANYYYKHSQLWSKHRNGIERADYNEKMEILAQLFSHKRPIVFLCKNHQAIKRAIKLADEFNVKYYICDLGNEAFRVIDELRQAKAKVLCALTFKAPDTNVYGQLGKEALERAEKNLYAKNIKKLSDAGIHFAFSSLGTDDPKSFMEGVKKAVDNGLSKEDALKALTISAAQILGLSPALGTIEKGKIANLFLMEGDLFSKDAKIKYVFADGIKFDMKKASTGKEEKPTVNVTGKWEFTVQGMKLTLDFVQEGASLSGKLGTPFGVFDFSDGMVFGNQITFDISLAVGGQNMDLYFSAEVTRDKMEGSVVQGTAGSAEFTAKRVPQGGLL